MLAGLPGPAIIAATVPPGTTTGPGVFLSGPFSGGRTAMTEIRVASWAALTELLYADSWKPGLRRARYRPGDGKADGLARAGHASRYFGFAAR